MSAIGLDIVFPFGKMSTKPDQVQCPECGHTAVETMPTTSCLFFYACKGCAAVLKPKPGDCCVFCSYGDVRCPSKQNGSDAR
jgi:hypothetical protein